MSTEYSFGLAAGFEVSMGTAIKKWGKRVREKSRKEDRFDPVTGKKVKPVKVVVQEAGLRLLLGGKLYGLDDPRELTEAICEEISGARIAADVQIVDDSPHDLGEDDVLFVSPGLELPDPSSGELDYGRVTASGGFLIQDLARSLPKFEALGARLEQLGLKPSLPMVRIVGGYG